MIKQLSVGIRVAKPLALYKQCTRYSSNASTTISDFASKKKGTSAGPFIELPEFKSLQDSILIKIPSFCSVYGNLGSFNAVSPDSKAGKLPVVVQEYDEITGLSKLTTEEYPANLIMAPSTSMSNIVVVKIDNYKKGLFVPDFFKNVLCYSGSLSLSEQNEVTGLGIFAITGKGPIYKVAIPKNEELTISRGCVIAYDSNVKLQVANLESAIYVPKKLKLFFDKYVSQYTRIISSYWKKYFDKAPAYYKITGPGSLFLQAQKETISSKYTKEL